MRLFKLGGLRPTQATLGLEEVSAKRQRWRDLAGDAKISFISKRTFPAVIGPADDHYIIDGHHLCRALMEERVDGVRLSIMHDLSHLDSVDFWQMLESRKLAHPYDAKGCHLRYEAMPKSLGELDDDPFRALAATARRSSGRPKDDAPFAEFHWARRLRDSISLSTLKTQPARAAEIAKEMMGYCVAFDGGRGALQSS